jgi:hypothetical protein
MALRRSAYFIRCDSRVPALEGGSRASERVRAAIMRRLAGL